MKTYLLTIVSVLGCCAAVQTASATLLNVVGTSPIIAYSSGSSMAVTYSADSGLFSVVGNPGLVSFGSGAPSISTGTKSLAIQIMVDSTGALVSGSPSNQDLVVMGTVNRVVSGVTNTYTGVLVEGQVLGFGFLENGSADLYDFRFQVTGGSMASLFGNVVSVTLNSAASTFSNNFTIDFHGAAQGNVARNNSDTTPPVITCPDNIVVEGNTNVDGSGGAYVTFPNPTLDDPTATLVFNPTNGSFFPLPAGLASTNYTVVCTATDPSGNSSQCSFVITVQDTTAPAFEAGNPVISGCDQPLIVTNDPGQCSATFSFARPMALDTDSDTPIPASVSAIDQQGAVISLADIGGGILQGIFPKGSNVLTFTASDGRGNSAQAKCTVVVVDGEAPNLMCMDQTATFKPIETNALSCISAEFGCNDIASNNTIWFSSVLNAPSGNQAPFTVHFFDQHIELNIDEGTNLVIDVPEALVTFSNGVAVATTQFINGQWVTVSPSSPHNNTFLSGIAFNVPFDLDGCHSPNCCFSHCFEGGRKKRHHDDLQATWCGRFEISRPGVLVNWAWSAAVYSQFSTDYNALGVKPVDARSCNWHTDDDAGTPENFKRYVVAGARGDGRWSSHGDSGDKFTGILTDFKRANLGVGTVCMGAVVFDTPLAADNCDNSVTVTCDPPSGSVFGPGDHTINCTAVDSSGNSNTCSFTLTVLSPLHVVFDSPCDDNLNDNTSQPDDGFSDMNCPDDPSTPQNVTRFQAGSRIVHLVRILDCNDNDVTSQLAPFITVHIDVTERQGSYYDSILVKDLAESYTGVGTPGGIMTPAGSQFQYVLDTKNYEADTINNSKFFRACVWVDYNSSPGIPVGMEDVILESK
ncbi:MAG TPA: HYR domain-containing protein [Verrucomicrobiae bacterium]|jgi:hypothetical protein|nr:HYR domain-containing protein [Verrucomicrobiae bacterium]